MSNTDAEILAGLEAALEAGTMTLFTPGANVRVIRVRFLEDEVYDGGIPQASYDNAITETYECDDTADAVRVLQREGVTFAATGSDYAANPDGSVIIDYATAEREEVSAHLNGFTPAAAALIERIVG